MAMIYRFVLDVLTIMKLLCAYMPGYPRVTSAAVAPRKTCTLHTPLLAKAAAYH